MLVNGQQNPVTSFLPGETKILQLASIGRASFYSLFLADSNYQNAWDAVVLTEDGNQDSRAHSLPLSMDYDYNRLFEYNTATFLAPGNRLAIAVTAPLTP